VREIKIHSKRQKHIKLNEKKASRELSRATREKAAKVFSLLSSIFLPSALLSVFLDGSLWCAWEEA
jgi:hypothetical protein